MLEKGFGTSFSHSFQSQQFVGHCPLPDLHHPVAISEFYKIHHTLILTPPSSTEYSIVRNAGGRTSEALRSIVCMDTLIGLEAVIVVHHTGSFTTQPIQQLPKTIEEANKECYIDCGLTHLTNASIRASLLSKDSSLEHSVSKMDFGEIIEFVSYYPFSGTPALSYYIYIYICNKHEPRLT